ncbi:MAG TPA: hypothetical protein VFH99_00715 [Candidatus Saccharimonadales bacterium]|nr:hypothetical protein [Candidatus Saccharimonadales bacterium]
MAQETQSSIPIFDEPDTLSEQIASRGKPLNGNVALLAELGGGILRFAGAAFPEADVDNVYAQYNERQPRGRGPHFDIYDKKISEDYPWLAVYNLAGRCSVAAAVMPNFLADEYDRLYPEPNEAAYNARRHFGALVLNSPKSDVYSGVLNAGGGLVLPQSGEKSYIIHEIVPEDPAESGSFIKMIVPEQKSKTLKELRDNGFIPLGELTRGIVGQEDYDTESHTPIPRPGRQPRSDDRGYAQTTAVDSGLLD